MVTNTQLTSVNTVHDIPVSLHGTPIESLLLSHNVNIQPTIDKKNLPQMIIGTCIDFRIMLSIPDRYAFIIRTAGARIDNQQFPLAFAISASSIKTIAVIGHTECRMINLLQKKSAFTSGIKQVLDWPSNKATTFFEDNASHYAVGNDVITFTQQQASGLQTEFLGILIVPLLYNVNDNKLYLINQKSST